MKTDVRFDLALFFLSLTQRIGNSDILVISTGSKCTLIYTIYKLKIMKLEKRSLRIIYISSKWIWNITYLISFLTEIFRNSQWN